MVEGKKSCDRSQRPQMFRLAGFVLVLAACLALALGIAVAGQNRGGRQPRPTRRDNGYHERAGANTRIAITIGDNTLQLDSIDVSVPSPIPNSKGTVAQSTLTVTIARRGDSRLGKFFRKSRLFPDVLITTLKRPSSSAPWTQARGWDYNLKNARLSQRGPTSVLLPSNLNVKPVSANNSKTPGPAWDLPGAGRPY